MTNIERLEQNLNYYFKNPALLQEALSHPSIRYKNSENLDYERLEFLGDSVIGFVITSHLFSTFPGYDEGQLAKMRSALVCKDTICDVAEVLDLDECLMMTKGEELSGGRENQNNVENCMEAIIGAIYLNSGIESAESVVLKLWSGIIAEGRQFVSDPKTALQEWSQGLSMSVPRYTVVERTGQAHAPMFKVMVSIEGLESEYGFGKSIKAAEKIAAKTMLQNSQNLLH